MFAANQGLYNGFLAAGMIWGLIDDNYGVKSYFTSCVIVAAAFGGATVSRRIFVTQGTPAVIALIFLQFGYKESNTFDNKSNPLYTLFYVAIAVFVSVIAGYYVFDRDAKLKEEAKSGVSVGADSQTRKNL